MISDLWVSFPERMITVCCRGGERSPDPHQDRCPLENDWTRRAGGAVAAALQIQPVALHHRSEKTTHFISRSFPLPLPLSFISLGRLSEALSLFFSISNAHTRTRQHTHTHAVYLFKTAHPTHPLKETHFSFAVSSKSLFTLN